MHASSRGEADRNLRPAISDPVLEHLGIEEALLFACFGKETRVDLAERVCRRSDLRAARIAFVPLEARGRHFVRNGDRGGGGH